MSSRANYLNRLKYFLRVDSTIENSIIREYSTHLEDKCEELRESGLSEDEADRMATTLLGPPNIQARQIGEIYAQGTWRQAIFAALPHLLVALLFALRWWQYTMLLSLIVLLIVGVVIYGWSHGKPTWLFPWLGYCLTPVITVGTLLIYLPGGWGWLAAVAYVPLAFMIVFSIAKKTIKIDWLFTSLMLLPAPIIIGWRLALGIDDITQWQLRLCEAAQLISLSFATLAITVATFIRVKQRWIKAGALVVPEIFLLVLVAISDLNAISLWVWISVILLAVIILLGPALIERKIRSE